MQSVFGKFLKGKILDILKEVDLFFSTCISTFMVKVATLLRVKLSLLSRLQGVWGMRLMFSAILEWTKWSPTVSQRNVTL